MNISNEYKNYEIKNMFDSDLTIDNHHYWDFINSVSNALKLDCIKYGYNFIKNIAKWLGFEKFWKW